ncbi:unnamed protein product [Protopolystoma xenopodis]|uniref:Uncharacterized protein n=1 Tax=Protopolystoma xenopodis TaxID=117903 RepID=A0A3S5AL58_9PLAT|nr:unnamed protein product [Protopolystoma xenopodis]
MLSKTRWFVQHALDKQDWVEAASTKLAGFFKTPLLGYPRPPDANPKLDEVTRFVRDSQAADEERLSAVDYILGLLSPRLPTGLVAFNFNPILAPLPSALVHHLYPILVTWLGVKLILKDESCGSDANLVICFDYPVPRSSVAS